MILTCNCLNVTVKVGNCDLRKTTVDLLSLCDQDKNDSFFKQDVFQVEQFVGTEKVHAGLVQSRQLLSWTVFCCINCEVQTHAVHRRGASEVLINSKLLNGAAIENVKSSDNFSKIYKIVVYSNKLNGETKKIYSYLPREVEASVKTLRQLMSDAIGKETLAVEDRINKFKEEQYELLNKLRDRAFIEQENLVKIILNANQQTQKQPNSTNKMTLPDSPTESGRLMNEPLLSNNSLGSNLNSPTYKGKNSIHSPKRQKSNSIKHSSSIDAEGLFELDGIDDTVPDSSDYGIDESDNEGHNMDDSITIPRNRTASLSLAKSLPMNIPVFMSQNHDKDDFNDELPQDNELDIAASIKALAKSVHGDTVFGELPPRPRFSAQI